MTRNKIYAIVEGKGEANRPSSGEQSAIVLLIAKLLHELSCWHLFPAEKYPSFRLSYGQFFKGNKLENAIRLHAKYLDCAALLIILDMDDDCPVEKAFELTNRVRQMEQLPFSVTVVCAVREFESWFLASLESIHPGQIYPDDPEKIRDAKGWLRKKFRYRQTRDQSAYTRKLDIALAYENARSFRRLYHAFEEIASAVELNDSIVTPTSSSTPS